MNEVQEIKNIFKTFQSSRADYVYLKNFEYLLLGKPYGEKDIDIIISHKHFEKAKKIFARFGYYPIGKGAVVNFHSPDKKIIFGVHVDGLYFLGSKFLAYKEIFHNSYLTKNIRIPNDTYLFLIILLNTMMHSLSKHQDVIFPKKYSSLLKRLWVSDNIDKSAIFTKLRICFTSGQSKRILQEVLDNKAINYRDLRFTAFIKTFSFERIQRAIHRFFKSKGKIIVFIGTDGVGKTHIINNLRSCLTDLGSSATYHYMGYWSYSVIGLQKLTSTKIVKKITESQKKAKKKNGFLIFIREGLFTVDMLLRYFFKLRPLEKEYDFVIVDRYFYDMLLNENQTFFLRFVARLFPKPDYLFYLHTDPVLIHKRKGQHTVEQSRIYQKKYDSIFASLQIKNKFKIDTVHPVKKIIHTLCQKIF